MAKGSGGVGKGGRGKAGSVSGATSKGLSMASVPGYVKALGANESKVWAGVQSAMKSGNTSLPLMTDAIKASGLSKAAFHKAANSMWDKGTKGFVMHNHDYPQNMSAHAAAGAMKSPYGMTFHAISVPE